jgi:hypothetical protein
MAIHKNRAKIEMAIRNRQAFKIASMTGEPGVPFMLGQLPDNERTIVSALGNAITYTVYSYSTPIAYVTNDTLHVIDHRYSVTTTNHQHICLMAAH